MKRTVNASRVAEGIVALLLALCLLWLLVTRVYLNYVTPRTLPYLYFAVVALLSISAFNLIRMFEVAHIHRYTQVLALLIPLALLTASITEKGLWSAPLIPAADAAYEGSALANEPYTMQTPAYAGRILHGYDADGQTITVAQEETYFWLTEIYNNPAPFLNYTIHTMGQVMKDPKYFSADCFSPTRKLMTCCVADLYTIGFKCQYADAQSLAEDAWVSVTGRLQMVDLEEYQELRLVVDQIEPCAAPTDPYVYSF
ncbi:MAG: TIGR03943 family protein [Clostridiales bacterium]|nr:TIGR03943 family protein [Clostridiales bacterium]